MVILNSRPGQQKKTYLCTDIKDGTTAFLIIICLDDKYSLMRSEAMLPGIFIPKFMRVRLASPSSILMTKYQKAP
jgi:hypothetical protein